MLRLPKAAWAYLVFGATIVAALATLLTNIETLDRHRIPRPAVSTEVFDVAQATNENRVSILLLEIDALKRSTRETATWIDQQTIAGTPPPQSIIDAFDKDMQAIKDKETEIAKIKQSLQ